MEMTDNKDPVCVPLVGRHIILPGSYFGGEYASQHRNERFHAQIVAYSKTKGKWYLNILFDDSEDIWYLEYKS